MAAAKADLQSMIDAESGDTLTVSKSTLRAAIGPSQGALDRAFGWLVPGLIVLTGISLIGLLVLVGDGNANTPPELALTAFTALLTGVLGLFIKSPQQQ